MSKERNARQLRRIKRIFSRVAFVLCCMHIFDCFLCILLFGSCLVFYKQISPFNSNIFGDCNNPKLYIWLVIFFLNVELVLAVTSSIGFYKRKYAYIMPFVALRGVCVFYAAFVFFYGFDGLNCWEIFYNLLWLTVQAVLWVFEFVAYLKIYSDTYVVSEPAYDDT